MTQRDDMIKIWDAQEAELARLVNDPAAERFKKDRHI
jgi:hypothetical protein